MAWARVEQALSTMMWCGGRFAAEARRVQPSLSVSLSFSSYTRKKSGENARKRAGRGFMAWARVEQALSAMMWCGGRFAADARRNEPKVKAELAWLGPESNGQYLQILLGLCMDCGCTPSATKPFQPHFAPSDMQKKGQKNEKKSEGKCTPSATKPFLYWNTVRNMWQVGRARETERKGRIEARGLDSEEALPRRNSAETGSDGERIRIRMMIGAVGTGLTETSSSTSQAKFIQPELLRGQQEGYIGPPAPPEGYIRPLVRGINSPAMTRELAAANGDGE
ncbi:hypothetical protein C8R45DRAFT_942222 [Mycena sanguinolenta]|nr:hypothetical protein C8R45DRAFT_942222 [Mycena sanguinolenta]